MHTCYCIELQIDRLDYVLSEEESFHLTKVMRAQPGLKVLLANGQGLIAEAMLAFAHDKKSIVKVENFREVEKKIAPHIHLAIAPTKNNDRIEWLIEKGTEMGMDEFTLLKCQNNERTRSNLERLNKIALSAFKQSKRTYLPKINDLVPFEKFISSYKQGGIAHCYDLNIGNNQKTDLPNFSIEGPILIGPEGDFTIKEVEMAVKSGYHTLSLGQNRLRTETAGLLAIAAQALRRT